MNPGEAVMCWACYTPLAGGAGGAVAGAGGAGGGTAAMSTPAMISDEGEKKPVEKWQIALIGVALLLGVGFGVRSMMGGDPTVEELPLTAPQPGAGNTLPPVNTPPVTSPEASGGGPITSGPVPPPEPVPFTMVSAPNASQPWSVMAIVPTDPRTTPQRAVGLARFVRSAMGVAKNKPMQIYVLSDRQAGSVFNEFQIQRRQSALGAAEYSQLAQTQLWSRCLAFYEVNGGRERFLYPSRSPGNWWARR
jgi:hypothetical protein